MQNLGIFSHSSPGSRVGGQDFSGAAAIPTFFVSHLCSGLLRPELFTVPYLQFARHCEGTKGQPWVVGAVCPAPGAPQMVSKLQGGAEFQECRLCTVLAAAEWSISKSWDCPQCLQWRTQEQVPKEALVFQLLLVLLW